MTNENTEPKPKNKKSAEPYQEPWRKAVLGISALALVGSLGWMSGEMGKNLNPTTSGNVDSIESVSRTDCYGEIQDIFEVHYTTPDGKKVTAFCDKKYAEDVQSGDKILADLVTARFDPNVQDSKTELWLDPFHQIRGDDATIEDDNWHLSISDFK